MNGEPCLLRFAEVSGEYAMLKAAAQNGVELSRGDTEECEMSPIRKYFTTRNTDQSAFSIGKSCVKSSDIIQLSHGFRIPMLPAPTVS